MSASNDDTDSDLECRCCPLIDLPPKLPPTPEPHQPAQNTATGYGQVRAALALAVLLGRLGCARFQPDQPHSRSVPGRFAAIDRVPAVPREPASWRLS